METPHHCPEHERMRTDLTRAEMRIDGQACRIDVMQKRADSDSQLLQEIKATLAAMTMEMRSNFEAQRNRSGDIMQVIEQRINYGDKVISERGAILAEIQKDLDRLNEGRWFLDYVSNTRDNLPWMLARAVLWILAVLVILSWADLGSIIRKWVER